MKRLLVFLFLLYATDLYAVGVTYWVKQTGGLDGTCGTAVGGSDPGLYMRNPSAGMACMGSGDTLRIREGIYDDFLHDGSNVTIPSGPGTGANPYTRIVGNGDGTSIFRPSSGTPGYYIIGFNGGLHHHVEITGLTFNGELGQPGTDTFATGAFSSSSNTIGDIHHIWFHHNVAINANCNTIEVGGLVDSTFAYNDLGRGMTCNATAVGGSSHVVYLGGQTHRSERVLVEHNLIADAPQYGVQAYPDGVGHVIRYNKFTNNCQTYLAAGIILYGRDHLVTGNVIHDQGGPEGCKGIWLRGVSNSLIWNNTIVNNTQQAIFGENGSSNIVCRNNLMIGNGSTIGGTSCTATSNSVTTGTIASHFVNAGAGDFTLVSTSGAINQGTPTIGTWLLNPNLPVPVVQVFNGSAPDAGAFQKLGPINCVVQNATPTLIDCTPQNNAFPGILPVTGITGWTVTGKTIASNVRTGNNTFQITTTAPFVAGTCALSYAQTGNLTDSALIGNVYNQELFAGAATCTNNVSSGAPVPVVTQSHGAMFAWSGNESSGPQIGTTNPSQALRAMVFGKYLARFGLKTTVADTTATNYALRYSLNGAAYSVVPAQTGTLPVGICDAPAISAGNTSQRLTTGAFIAGRAVEIFGSVPTITMTNGQSTELLYPICYGPGLVAGTDNIKFLVHTDTGVALANDTNAILNVDVVAPGLSGL